LRAITNHAEPCADVLEQVHDRSGDLISSRRIAMDSPDSIIVIVPDVRFAGFVPSHE
jgi:hypothetical protein